MSDLHHPLLVHAGTSDSSSASDGISNPADEELESSTGSIEARCAPVFAALEFIPSAAFVCDASGRVAGANAAARRLLETDGTVVWQALASADADVSPLSLPGLAPHFLVVTRRLGRVEAAVEKARHAWTLTGREVQVLAEITAGRSNRDVADRLGLAQRTAELHVTSLLRKAGAESRAQLILALWDLSETA